MDFTERLDMFYEGGMIDSDDIKSIHKIIDIFKNEYDVELNEENASTFISHICAAFYRYTNHEDIEPLPQEIINEMISLETYDLSIEIFDKLMKVIQKPFNSVERGYVLLHINNLISLLKSQGEWKLS